MNHYFPKSEDIAIYQNKIKISSEQDANHQNENKNEFMNENVDSLKLINQENVSIKQSVESKNKKNRFLAVLTSQKSTAFTNILDKIFKRQILRAKL